MWLLPLPLPAHKTFSGYLLPPTASLSIGGDSLAARTVPRTRAYSYYRNRICQIEVEMLSAFPCHLASVYRLIVCLPVCLFVRLPSSLLSLSLLATSLVARLGFGLGFGFWFGFGFGFAFGFGLGLWAWAWVYLPVCRSLFAVYLIVCLFGGPTLINCRFYWHFGFDVVVYWVRKKFIAYFCAHAPRNCLPSTGQRAHKGIVCSACHYPLSWLAGSFRLFASFNCLLCGNCLPCGQLMNLIRHARIIIVPAHD